MKNILVVRTDRIGDVVLTTPALKALRDSLPKARITLLVSPLTFPLVSSNPNINKVIVDDRNGEHKGIFGFFKLVGSIRKKNYDSAIIFHTKRRTNLLCALAGIRNRIGYKNNKYGFLLNKPIADGRHLGKKHEVDYCLDLLKEIGINGSSKQMHVSTQGESDRWAQELFRQEKLKSDVAIAIHLGASDPSKCWPIENFVETMNYLCDKYQATIILVGGPETQHLSAQALKKTKASIIDLTGKTSVSQLSSLLKNCRLLISNDSGPVHIAAGLGIPVVSIFTRNQPGINIERWRPLESRSQAVSVPFDPEPSFEKADSASAEYLHKLKPEAVLEAVDAVYKLC